MRGLALENRGQLIEKEAPTDVLPKSMSSGFSYLLVFNFIIFGGFTIVYAACKSGFSGSPRPPLSPRQLSSRVASTGRDRTRPPRGARW